MNEPLIHKIGLGSRFEWQGIEYKVIEVLEDDDHIHILEFVVEGERHEFAIAKGDLEIRIMMGEMKVLEGPIYINKQVLDEITNQ